MVIEKIRKQAATIIVAYFTGWKVNEEWTFIWTLSDNRNLSRCHFVALPITIVLSIWFPFAFHSISLGPQTLQMHGHWKDTQTGGDYNRSLFYRLEGELRVKYLFLVKLLSKTLLACSVSKFLAQIIVGEELGYRNVFNTRKGWGVNKRYNFFRKRGGGKIRGSRRKRRDPPAPFSVHFNLQSIIADQWTVASFQTEFFFFMIRLHYRPRNHARFDRFKTCRELNNFTGRAVFCSTTLWNNWILRKEHEPRRQMYFSDKTSGTAVTWKDKRVTLPPENFFFNFVVSRVVCVLLRRNAF